MRRIIMICAVAAFAFADTVAKAEIVSVNVTGQVFFNGIAEAPLNGVGVGNSAVLSFTVDSNNFVDGIPGDLRSYPIDHASFSLTFQPSGVTVGLQDPFPAGQTPYFTLVDGFPVSDGFFVSTNIVSPGGVPISQTPFQLDLDLGYTGDTLSSLDILDAVGTYDFTGLTRFAFNLWQFSPDNVRLGIDFESMTIVPEPGVLAMLAMVGPFALAYRRRR